LIIAAWKGAHALVVWLLDEKGADVNGTAAHGRTAIFYAKTPDILTALLDRGADPCTADRFGMSPLMWHMLAGTVDTVARLLQDPRVRATVNMQDGNGRTVLHYACRNFGVEDTAAPKVHLLLQAGANPIIPDKSGLTPLAYLRQFHPNRRAVIALLEHYPVAKKDAEKASLVVKARRLAVAAIGNIMAPSCLQARVARGQPCPSCDDTRFKRMAAARGADTSDGRPG
jgi:hypothetical protein